MISVHLKVDGSIIVHIVDSENILGQLGLVGARVTLLSRHCHRLSICSTHLT